MTAAGTVPAGTTEKWRDPKRHLWLIGLVVPSLAFVGLGMHAATGWGVWFWIGPIVILGIVPLIDLVAGLDRSNPPDELVEALENDRYYRWITYWYLPIQYVGFVAAMWVIARGDLTTLDKVGLAVSIGCVGGIGINTAHELGHKKESHERRLAKVALAQSFYGHFYIEHNRGHHVRVATPADPASSRVGETFYAFWPRTVVGSLRSAWRLEKRRLARRNLHPWRLSNDVVSAWLLSVVLWGALVAWLGIGVLPYLLVQAVVGLSLLEVVNYMEHYGMLRQVVGQPGRQRFERVDPSHSWNSNNIATNVLLYHLQRHSDHHANPTRRYQTLRDYAESPVLPTGYAGMIVLALVPPLWRRVMDPRVLAHYGGDVRLANIHPSRRTRVLAAYPPPGASAHAEASATAEVSATAEASATGDTPTAGDARGRAGGVRLASRDGSVDRADASRSAHRHACPGCHYVFDETQGDVRQGFPAGTAWADVPDDWSCPDCGVREKVDFVAVPRP